MKPVHIKEARQKEVRRLLRRQWEISKHLRNLGLIKLEKPIRHGWFKEIIITHRIEIFRNKELILEVYDKFEKDIWARTKDKAEFKWQHQTSQHLIYKDIPTLSKKQYNKLSDGAKGLCIPFQFYSEKHKIKTRFYINIPKGAYKIKFTKAYITHRKRTDPLLESERDFIESQLYKKGYYNITEAYYSYPDPYWKAREYRQEKLKINNSLRELKKYALEDLINDTISWERN
jgi:hypothetical protein